MGTNNVECLNEQTEVLHQVYNALLFVLLGVVAVVVLLVVNLFI